MSGQRLLKRNGWTSRPYGYSKKLPLITASSNGQNQSRHITWNCQSWRCRGQKDVCLPSCWVDCMPSRRSWRHQWSYKTWSSTSLTSHWNSSNNSRWTLPRSYHSQRSPSTWWNSMHKLPSLMKPSFMANAWLEPTMMNGTLHRHPLLGPPQTLRIHHPKKRKRSRRRGDILSHPNPRSRPNRRARKVYPPKTIPMTTLSIVKIREWEEWKQSSRWIPTSQKLLITGATVRWSQSKHILAGFREKSQIRQSVWVCG